MMNWQPTASLETLRSRAELQANIRQYFQSTGVMEVDVPILSEAGVTDLNIDCIQAQVFGTTQYLQSSPEYYMKRLLASGLGSIYYMGKAFRNSELGRRHQPEFTMLEWYRPGWDEHQLINEVAELLQCVGLDASSPQIISYEELFQQVTGLNPHQADLSGIQVFASNLAGNDFSAESRSTCLDLVFSIKVEPSLAKGVVFVYDYPACQSALAQLGQDSHGNTVARRFEAYLNGMELANGYSELVDAVELKSRFDADIALRHAAGKSPMSEDQALLAAMESGLPSCAGVALGVDRLLMQLLSIEDISQVIAFSNSYRNSV